jgi:hypothetical protein
VTSRDLYRVLQVDPRADAEVLEAAYRRLARKYHPDVSSAPDAEARMRELNDAYATLRDPVRRASYDRGRAEAHRPEPRATTATTPRPRAPRAARPRESAPRPRPAPARPEPATRRVLVRLPAPWEELADWLLANRYVLLGAASALLLAVLLAAVAARLFVPGEPFSAGGRPAAEPTPAVVLVTRVPTAEPTAIGRPAAGRATPASWPPFIYVPVPVQGPPGAQSGTPEETATSVPPG